jgi:hypothetical protein
VIEIDRSTGDAVARQGHAGLSRPRLGIRNEAASKDVAACVGDYVGSDADRKDAEHFEVIEPG